MAQYEYVPLEPMQEIIREWLDNHRRSFPGGSEQKGRDDGATLALSRDTGVSTRHIRLILSGETISRRSGRYRLPGVTVKLADRIVTGIGHPEYWHTRLAA